MQSPLLGSFTGDENTDSEGRKRFSKCTRGASRNSSGTCVLSWEAPALSSFPTVGMDLMSLSCAFKNGQNGQVYSWSTQTETDGLL